MNHFVFTSSAENKVLEFDSKDEPPRVGQFIQLPFGPNKELCRYRVMDVYVETTGTDLTIYYYEVEPA
jgi:hypothetical protein